MGFTTAREVGEQILDLAAVVELGTAHDLVGHAETTELFLQSQALGVRPVEDGDVAPAVMAPVVQPRDLVTDPLGFVALVLGVVAGDELAAHLLGPQRLGLAHGVVGDDRVGGVEDRLGRPVVLLEHDHRGVGERLLELEDVPNVSASKSVHTLVGVTHDADVAVLLGEHEDELVLGAVGVLVLVHEEVAEALLVVEQHVGMGLEQVHRHHEQVVEVHGAGRMQPVLVLPIDVADLALEDRLGPRHVGLEVDQLVLGRTDGGVHRAGLKAFRIDVEIADDVARQAHGVGLVVDRERGLVTQHYCVASQDPHAR